MSMPLPELDPLEEYRPELVRMVAKTSWLAHPDAVKAIGRAIFPTVRARKQHKRGSEVIEDGIAVGMYDDNTTPRWAILWAHGIPITHHPSGRTFAHVWEGADDIASYNHLANIVIVPEPFASLTDKQGPLTSYLRWHAWSIYGWKPASAPLPEKPKDFDGIPWRYLSKIDHPLEFIRERITTLNNARTRTLRPLMERLGTL
ncbi:MAG: hypothetical protein U0894_17240 [Pirellulales bacterium]